MSGIKAHIKRLNAVIKWLETLDQDEQTVGDIKSIREQINELEERL